MSNRRNVSFYFILFYFSFCLRILEPQTVELHVYECVLKKMNHERLHNFPRRFSLGNPYNCINAIFIKSIKNNYIPKDSNIHHCSFETRKCWPCTSVFFCSSLVSSGNTKKCVFFFGKQNNSRFFFAERMEDFCSIFLHELTRGYIYHLKMNGKSLTNFVGGQKTEKYSKTLKFSKKVDH